MNYKKTKINDGIILHTINTEKFKTNLISIFLTSKLTREDITKKALILTLLRRGTKTMPTQEEISKALEDLYGANFDCGIDKIGDNHVLKFYVESVNENYLYKKEETLEKSIQILMEMVFNPLTKNGGFKEEYLAEEKENLKRLIEGKKDNKAQYSTQRCIEEMYKNKPYGLYKYGYVEDLEKENVKTLYEEYKKLINNCQIDIFISGNLEGKNVEKIITSNPLINELQARNTNYLYNNPNDENNKQEKVVNEQMQVSQGKLVIGLNTPNKNKPAVTVYNAILGGGANSKLFQNVREKASLAYSAGSVYIKTKNKILIKSGIEQINYEKALSIIKKQLEDMKQGNFEEKNIQDAKKLIVASFKSMQDEQDSEISFYFGAEMQQENPDVEQKIKEIESVSKEEIINCANEISINTIYFLSSK